LRLTRRLTIVTSRRRPTASVLARNVGRGS
jgi:hypothetical protein